MYFRISQIRHVLAKERSEASVAPVIVHIRAGCLNAAPLIVFYMELFPCIKYLKTLTHLACACTLHDQHSTIFACSHVSAFAAFWA